MCNVLCKRTFVNTHHHHDDMLLMRRRLCKCRQQQTTNCTHTLERRRKKNPAALIAWCGKRATANQYYDCVWYRMLSCGACCCCCGCRVCFRNCDQSRSCDNKMLVRERQPLLWLVSLRAPSSAVVVVRRVDPNYHMPRRLSGYTYMYYIWLGFLVLFFCLSCLFFVCRVSLGAHWLC